MWRNVLYLLPWIWICIVDPDSHRGSGFILWTFPLMFRDFLINQRKISFTISVGNLWMERIYSNRIKRSLSGGGQYDNKSVEAIQKLSAPGFHSHCIQDFFKFIHFYFYSWFVYYYWYYYDLFRLVYEGLQNLRNLHHLKYLGKLS